MVYYLSLGSNQGDPPRNLARGIRLLARWGTPGPVSPPYRTRPLDMPADTPVFTNLALRLESDLDPPALLRRLKEIEAALGRRPAPGPPRSRPLDMDILLAGDRVVNTPELTIPHPRMAQRAFVLIPLCDIAPDRVHPVTGRTIREMATRLEGDPGVWPAAPLPSLAD